MRSDVGIHILTAKNLQMAFGDTLERSEPEGESVSISLSEVENLISENKSVLTKNNAPEKFVSVTNIFGPVVSN